MAKQRPFQQQQPEPKTVEQQPAAAATDRKPRDELAPCPCCGHPAGRYATANGLRYRKCAGWKGIPGCGHTFSESVNKIDRTDWEAWYIVKRKELGIT